MKGSTRSGISRLHRSSPRRGSVVPGLVAAVSATARVVRRSAGIAEVVSPGRCLGATAPDRDGRAGRRRGATGKRAEQALVGGQPELGTAVLGLVVEQAVRAVVARDGLEEVVG